MTTLAELRQASLQEQKRNAPEPAPVPEIIEDRWEASAAPAAPASNGNGHHAPRAAEIETAASAPAVPAPLPIVEAISVPAPQEPAVEALMMRVRERLAQKTIHPTGAKATVDMSPALFHRAKRYCLNHNNVTLRQLMLDLLTTFLDEEGY